ncbi:hypothetical protein D3C78_1943150 [compost metagenome]
MLRDDQAVIGLGQKQHVVDHPGHALQVVQVGVQVFLVGLDIALLTQHDLGVSHQVAERGS